ncbi:MAG: hypothetical protein HUJ62_03900 [Streptococcus gallolyticus]|nr:hypothetical protein [Streptococcus gallolyticus]
MLNWFPAESAKIKEVRRLLAEENNKLKSNLTTLGYLEQLQVEEDNLLARVKALKRSL